MLILSAELSSLLVAFKATWKAGREGFRLSRLHTRGGVLGRGTSSA